jgi:hypothetical protein
MMMITTACLPACNIEVMDGDATMMMNIMLT